MKEQVRKDILDMLRDSIKAIKQDNITELRELSDHTLHSSTIYQDEDSNAIAVILYSLFKIYEKQKLQASPGWQFFHNDVLKLLDSAYSALITADFARYKISIKKLFELIAKFEKEFGTFITAVIEQSKIKKGSKIVYHGLSLGRTAELLGISQWDLMDYLGITNIADAQPRTMGVKERLNIAARLFK